MSFTVRMKIVKAAKKVNLKPQMKIVMFKGLNSKGKIMGVTHERDENMGREGTTRLQVLEKVLVEPLSEIKIADKKTKDRDQVNSMNGMQLKWYRYQSNSSTS